MHKLVDGSVVAILLANRHGAQWYSNHKVPELLFDPTVVKMVMNMEKAENPLHIAMNIEDYCDKTYGARTYYGDAMYLTVDWVPKGMKFSVIYDEGYEEVTQPYDEVFEA